MPTVALPARSPQIRRRPHVATIGTGDDVVDISSPCGAPWAVDLAHTTITVQHPQAQRLPPWCVETPIVSRHHPHQDRPAVRVVVVVCRLRVVVLMISGSSGAVAMLMTGSYDLL